MVSRSSKSTTGGVRLNEERTSELFGWVKSGWKKDESLRQRWNHWRDLLVGRFRRRGMDEATIKAAGVDLDSLSVNLVYLHARTQLPAIFARDPYVDVLPAKESDAPNAPVWEGLLNQALPTIGFKRECKRTVLDAICFGEGWHKWGWTGRNRYDQDSEEPLNGAAATPMAPTGFIAQMLATSGYQLGASAPSSKPKSRARRRQSTGETGADPVSHLLRDGPFCVRMAPHNVVVDPLSPDRDPLRSRFIALRYVKPLSEIKRTRAYHIPSNIMELGRGSYNGFNTFSTSSFSYLPYADPTERGGTDEQRYKNGLTGMGILWEVWAYDLDLSDLHLHRQMVTLLEGAPTPLLSVSWDEMLGENWSTYPIHRLALNEVPDEPPMSDFEAWAPLQEMADRLVQRTMEGITNTGRITAIDTKACVDGKMAIAIIEGAERGTIEVKGPPKDIVMPLEFPQVTAESQAMLGYLIETAKEISGVTENRRGAATARTATEAKIIEGSASVREQEKLDIVQDFCEEGIMTLVGLFQSFVDRDYVIRRTGTGGSVEWRTFGPDQQSGDIPDIRVRFESTKFANEQKNLQKWTAVLNMAIQLKPYLPQLPLQVIVANSWRAMGIENVQELLGPVTASNQRELQWLEIAMMLAGIPVQPQMDEDAKSHVDVIQVFLASPAAQQLQQTNPMGLQLIEMHLQMHIQMLDSLTSQQVQVGAQSAKSTTDLASGSEMSEANQARGMSQSNLPEMPAMAGASNELG
jgi:hypothetical protein